MKKHIIVIVSSLLLFSACNKETITGGGAVISEERTVPLFTGVQINGDGEANIKYGPSQKVTIRGYANLLPIYETNLVGTVLHLQFKPDQYHIKNNNIKIDIIMPELGEVRINGSANIVAKDFASGTNLSAFINGSGNIYIQDNKYANVSYNINGSGNITAQSTEATRADAEIHGSGNISLQVASILNAKISGSGRIDYWGNPATVNTQISGSGTINKK